MALSRLKKARTALTSTPKAAKKFASTLVSEGKKDIARKGSPAQRFADAPLGQYYLPKTARSALGVFAPSPRKVARDTSNVVRRPGPGTAAAAGGNLLSIATLPLAGVGAAKAARAGARVGPKATAAASRAMRGGEAGKISRFPLKGTMADRVRAQVFNKIRSTGAGAENRTQFLNRRIGEIQQEIKQIDAAARIKHPSSLRNLSNIRDKAGLPKGKALPRGLKAGEEGWVRMSSQGKYTQVRMGPGKFAESAEAGAKGVKGAYELQLAKSQKPGTMNVQWMQRIGKVRMGDVKGEMEAVKRSFAARGFTKVEYEPLSGSRTRLFEKVAKGMGVKSMPKPPFGMPKFLREGEEGAIRWTPGLSKRAREAHANVPEGQFLFTAERKGKGVQTAMSKGKSEMSKFDIDEDIDTAAPLMKRAADDVRAGRSRIAGFYEKMVKRGEEGFMRLPGGKGDDAAREVVRRANLKATRAEMKGQIAARKFEMSMDTEKSLQALAKGSAKVPVGHLAKKELRLRNVMKKIGMSPGKVIRGQGSIIEIEGRMPMTAALKRLGETDRISVEDVSKLQKVNIHPRRFPRN